MIDRTPVARDARPPLPAFEPVPRKPRHDGWTPARQVAFIEALADTGSVSTAAAEVNMTTVGAYQLRRQPGAEGFARAWEAALDMGVLRLKDEAFDRALNGQLVPVIAGGKLLGYRRRRNDRLIMFILRHYSQHPQHGSFRHTGHARPDPAPAPAATSAPAPAHDPAPGQAGPSIEPGAVIAAFAGFELDEAAQEQIIAALTASAARHRAMIERPHDVDEPDAPFVSTRMMPVDHPAAIQPFGVSPFLDLGEHREGEEPWVTLDLPDQRDAIATFMADQATRAADHPPGESGPTPDSDPGPTLVPPAEKHDRLTRFSRFLASGRPLDEWEEWTG